MCRLLSVDGRDKRLVAYACRGTPRGDGRAACAGQTIDQAARWAQRADWPALGKTLAEDHFAQHVQRNQSDKDRKDAFQRGRVHRMGQFHANGRG